MISKKQHILFIIILLLVFSVAAFFVLYNIKDFDQISNPLNAKYGLHSTTKQDHAIEHKSASSNNKNKSVADKNEPAKVVPNGQPKSTIVYYIKDIPKNITPAELDIIQACGFDIVTTEWGIDDMDYDQLKALMDELEKRDLKIVLDAGFSKGAWFRLGERLIWDKNKVLDYVAQFKNHPALFGWDISNEAGENFLQNGERTNLSQLKRASQYVRRADAKHPIIMRMHYWDEYDGDFGYDNPFTQGLADIVMLNLYSNYSSNGKTVDLPNMVFDASQKLINKIKEVDPQVDIWLALSAFQAKPHFVAVGASQLESEIKFASTLREVEAIGFFGWGDKNKNWYLPQDGKELIQAIKHNAR